MHSDRPRSWPHRALVGYAWDMPQTWTGSAPGKLILCGEHAVVHGQPAIALAVDRSTTVDLVERPGPSTLDVTPIDDARLWGGLRTLLPADGFGVRIRTDLPIGRGMGSSAALAVALIRALAQREGRWADLEECTRLGFLMERVFHGEPSGIDHTVSACGGALLYRRAPDGPVWSRLPVPNLPLVVLDSGLAVVLVEREGEGADARWWAGWRPFVVEETGLPSFLASWKTASGGGPPPGPFARFICPRPGSPRPILLAARAPVPDIRSTFGTLASGDPTPTSAGEVADLMLALCLPGMRDEGLDHAKVLRLHGRDWELWCLGGRHLPAPLDDLIRLVCARGTAAEAVGLLVGAAVDVEGRPTPALHLVVERDGARLERLFGVRSLRAGAGIEPTTLRERGPMPVVEADQWLGVEPQLEFELSPMDAIDVE